MRAFVANLLRGALRSRLPVTSGQVALSGPRQEISIRRDVHGIPHVAALSPEDAWFALGFCQGQDRGFQLELRLRTVRGSLSELAGDSGLRIDRLSRRIGFRRASQEQEHVLAPEVHAQLAAFARGVNAAHASGLTPLQPEFLLLRSRPSNWEVSDVIGVGKLVSFLLIGNWDVELARLKIVTADGPQALKDLNPSYQDSFPLSSPPGEAAGRAVDGLSADLAAFLAGTGIAGGSNSWALSGARTESGRPILANDPHLDPALPPHWYLAHLSTPEWSLAGATLVGSPAVAAGHNGFAAWGVTAGLADTTDLFLEEIGADGISVRSGEGFIAGEVHKESIKVRGKAPVTEEVLVTPRGPIISPALGEGLPRLSLRAVWLDARPARGFLKLENVRSFDAFRSQFEQWPLLSQNVTYADQDGRIAWQLVGEVPQRQGSWGTLPLPGWDPGAGWKPENVPLKDMPFVLDPPSGVVASANNQPATSISGPFLGVDWLDGYRVARIFQALDERAKWDIASTMRLQTDQVSLAWPEIRDTVLAVSPEDADAALAVEMLALWDGRLTAESPAAAVYQLFIAKVWQAVALCRAPNSWRWAMGQGFSELLPLTTFAAGRSSNVHRLIREQPASWFEAGWSNVLSQALGGSVRDLRHSRGRETANWAWGSLRTLTLEHPLGRFAALAPIYNRGPFPMGGDSNSIAQAGTTPLRPTANPLAIASLRMVIDVGNWDEARFSLPGGQSGNPLSPHYDDLLPAWRRGDGVALAFSEAAVARASRDTLLLRPLVWPSIKG